MKYEACWTPVTAFRTAMTENGEPSDDVLFRDLAPAIEFVCWVIVLLCPLLRLINGAAVTNDQFIFQVTLFSLALIGAIGLRIYNFLAR